MKGSNLKNKQAKLIPTRSVIGYTILAVISGLSGFAFIATINKVINASITSGLPKNPAPYLWTFLGITVVFFITRRWLSGGIINLSQKIYWNIRRDVIKLVLEAPFGKLQQYKSEVYSTLTVDAGNITNASFMVITFLSAIILIAACLIYMAFLSLALFAISLGVIAIAIILYLLRSRKSDKQFKDVRDMERNFMDIFTTILSGSKEININPQKGFDIYDRKLVGIIEMGERTNVNAFLKYLNSELISQLSFYFLITYVLIYAGGQFNIPFGIIVSFVFVLLFLLGPIVSVMTIMPAMSRAAISLKKMTELRKALENLENESSAEKGKEGKHHDFKTIEFRNFSFSFGDEKFSVGPINLRIDRNEVVFIYGGNGAGKTTFINAILKLYDIDSGEVYVDNRLIPLEEMDEIKAMFSPIFSDFYLFDEFYGIKDVDLVKASNLLNLFELNEKVTIENGRYSVIDLSTGQRKRLALISALLERRPIMILDEWAADQDPQFRKKFYNEILPLISREEDKTIIAITHDDKYYHLGDKLLKMEYGQLIESNKSEFEIAF
ncbi:MAG TPA: cyclic peptide export ABC transporter [Puia sp.]|nr:cyclic peptide export ABC transporter [Puia sp.]